MERVRNGEKEGQRDREKERGREGESLVAARRLFFLSLPLSVSFSLLLSIAVTWLMMIVVSAATPFAEYASRVEQAAKLVQSLLKDDYEEAEIRGTLKVVAQMLPTTEDIEFNREIVHVDNAWLHQAITALSHEKEARQRQLIVIQHRLSALARRLKPASEIKAEEPGDERARLQQILARSEYQPESEQQSTLQKWLRRAWRGFVRVLERIFSAGGESARAPNGLTLLLLRFLIYAVVGVAVIWGLSAIIRRQRRRISRPEKGGLREVLGEQIEEHVTAEDLIKAASELARAGEYRLAIRRAYIALLYELEQRGKLRLHRAKTNHDYLRALGSEPAIYFPVADLTNAYERVWYGHADAVSDDYSSFITRYRDVVGAG